MAYKDDYTKIFHNEKICYQMILPYRSAVRDITAKLESLDDEMKCTLEHSMIHTIKSRIKTPESIIEKLHRKNFPINPHGFEMLTDIGGIRVVCRYVNDIYYIRKLLLQYHEVVLVQEEDYIKHPKESGYRSLHMIVSIPVYLEDEVKKVSVEIQIRTIAMDMWASLEHEIRYKNINKVSEKDLKKLKECADTLAKTDLEMQRIYNEMNHIFDL